MRTERKISRSNIYHVMLRGINRQNIFEDDRDRTCFMTILKECKEISGFRLHAFVLMTNHIHLLIEPADEPLDRIFRRIGTRYAVWYNRKYQRAGHLFQDRFRSENVETDQYFITVLRYILQNPMKAGMESRPGSYRWSSYPAYMQGGGSVTDTQHALEVFGCREALTEYLAQENDDSVMDEESCDWRLRDDLAKEIMERITGCATVADFQRFDRDMQSQYVRSMYQERLSMGQIARLTGMSKATICRRVKEKNGDSVGVDVPVFREADMADYDFGDEIIW